MKQMRLRINRLLHCTIVLSILLILPVELDSSVDTPCAADEYFDGVVEMCSKCSDVCLPDDKHMNQYCKLNCNDYYRTVVLNSKSFKSIHVVENLSTPSTKATITDERIIHRSNELIQKPLFWTSVFSLVISVIATITLFVLCIVKASSRQTLCLRRTLTNRGVPLSSNKIVRSTCDNFKGRCLRPSEDSANGASLTEKHSMKEQINETSCKLVTNYQITPRYSISEEGNSSCEKPGARSELLLTCKGDLNPQALQANKYVVCNLNAHEIAIVNTGDRVERTVEVYNNSHCPKAISLDSVEDVIMSDTSNMRVGSSCTEKSFNYPTLQGSLGLWCSDARLFTRQNTAMSTYCKISDSFFCTPNISCEKESENIKPYHKLEIYPIPMSADKDLLESLDTMTAGATSTCTVIDGKMNFPPESAVNVKLNSSFKMEKNIPRYQNCGCESNKLISTISGDNKYSQAVVVNEESVSSWAEVLKSCGVKIRECYLPPPNVRQSQHGNTLNSTSSLQFLIADNIV